MLFVLFFLSGISGLIYQVVWVREFGNVLGATIQTTSLVVAIFMLGLGCGSFILGRWSDRRYQHAPESLLRAYGIVELIIAGLGMAVAVVLPRLHALAAVSSSYVRDSAGWFELSALSYAARGAIALGVLGPSAILMGGTLTLLIRHRVRDDVESAGGWKIAVLYAVNTAGAAAGAFLTDFALVPSLGLTNTQFVAVLLNVIAGAGALILARPPAPVRKTVDAAPSLREAAYMRQAVGPVAWVSLALMLSGFAAMGLEIVWLRHFTLLLGGFRAVFSLVLTIVLVGIGAGSLLGGYLDRRTARPARALMVVQALLVVSALIGLGWTTVEALDTHRRAIELTLASLTPLARWITELWYNARPMLTEVGVPALLMGCSFPLGNAVIQRTERAVGSRAGALYLANTAGAVCGSLVTGFVLLPVFGMQGSATALALAAALAIAPLYLGTRAGTGVPTTSAIVAALVPALMAAVAVVVWLRLPADYVLGRSLARPSAGERLLSVREGVTEVIGVTEVPGRGRGLITNGHPMSSTALLDQRYMRALAHVPLLSMSLPTHVLVIGFGVGNSTHAATLHPSVERVDVADLSRDILGHAGYFRDVNKDVLDDPRVSVYVNDGRQHLEMQPAGTYDLITLEPPPIAHAGVAALYSREFYALARSRLKPGGYISQWLPAYQVPPETSLAMVRAFIEVFPQSVLLSGTQAELLLLGTNGASIEIDPGRVARALDQAPDVAADLRRLDLGSVTEIVGTFVGSADTLVRATRESPPVSDDHPLQEYGVRSAIGSGTSWRVRVDRRSGCSRDVVSTMLRRRTACAGRGGAGYVPCTPRRGVSRGAGYRRTRRVRRASNPRKRLPRRRRARYRRGPQRDRRHPSATGQVRRSGRRVSGGPEAAGRLRGRQSQSWYRAGRQRPRGGVDRLPAPCRATRAWQRRRAVRARKPAPRSARVRGSGGLFARGGPGHAGLRGSAQRPRDRAGVSGRPGPGDRALQAGGHPRPGVR